MKPATFLPKLHLLMFRPWSELLKSGVYQAGGRGLAILFPRDWLGFIDVGLGGVRARRRDAGLFAAEHQV